MDHQRPSLTLFDVYLRLRPSFATDKERFLDVEQTDAFQSPTHITIKPPVDDKRKRAVEKFAFTRVFEEHAGQRELFENTGVLPLVEGVLGAQGKEGRDGLVATLGVTGSGKSHTILGSKSQRGLTQLTLDVLFQHTAPYLANIETNHLVIKSLCAADVSEASLFSATQFLDSVYGGDSGPSLSRATTPALDTSFTSAPSSKRYIPRVSTLPHSPNIDDIGIEVDTSAEYAIIVSMYEVYNDRIFDLLTGTASAKMLQKRRALLFKSTELSPDRKVVAGLRKVICSSLEEALLVLETGLHERRVAGTGSNAVSSRSHGFFCMEIKKRRRCNIPSPWSSSTMTIVDLAGSERARNAKTAGATLAEAGKINESLMYLGQCMQMQSDNANTTTPNLVPFRQCKLTELLFSNSLGTNNSLTHHKTPQKSIMIVTADPLGDFNATSQILRYSALAREVTVPRIPSVTSTILSGAPTAGRPNTASSNGRMTPSAVQEELELALATIADLRQQLEVSQLLMQEETQRRQEAESSWKRAEIRIDSIEEEIREELFCEFEVKLTQEQRRWRAARDAELDAQDDHLDRKIELLTQNLTIYEDETAEAEKENLGLTAFDPSVEAVGKFGACKVKELEDQNRELQDENRSLREKMANLEREKESMRSPSKKLRVLKTPSRRWEGSGIGLDS